MTFDDIWKEAISIGDKAGSSITPTPMLVQQHSNMIDDTSQVVKEYCVPDGVCGFAGIVFDPARQPFVKWLVREYPNITHKHYKKGRELFMRGFGQSMQRKEAAANAMAKFFNENGINCYSWSRMD